MRTSPAPLFAAAGPPLAGGRSRHRRLHAGRLVHPRRQNRWRPKVRGSFSRNPHDGVRAHVPFLCTRTVQLHGCSQSDAPQPSSAARQLAAAASPWRDAGVPPASTLQYRVYCVCRLKTAARQRRCSTMAAGGRRRFRKGLANSAGANTRGGRRCQGWCASRPVGGQTRWSGLNLKRWGVDAWHLRAGRSELWSNRTGPNPGEKAGLQVKGSQNRWPGAFSGALNAARTRVLGWGAAGAGEWRVREPA